MSGNFHCHANWNVNRGHVSTREKVAGFVVNPMTFGTGLVLAFQTKKSVFTIFSPPLVSYADVRRLRQTRIPPECKLLGFQIPFIVNSSQIQTLKMLCIRKHFIF